jgi:DNA-binding GntR family transcriptional regulator
VEVFGRLAQRHLISLKSHTMSNSKPLRQSYATHEAIRSLLGTPGFSGGDKISEGKVKLALARLGIAKPSVMAIRKAFTRLEAEQIFRIVPQSGTFIVGAEMKTLREIWDNRVALEELIASQLAKLRSKDLSEANRIVDDMKIIAGDDEYRKPGEIEQAQFLRLDEEFHVSLAEAAGYEALGYQLKLLRTRLKVAANTSPPVSAARMLEVIDEHRKILRAIIPDGSSMTATVDSIRPDINMVRMAVRSHLRNSAKDWWSIHSSISREPAGLETWVGYSSLDVPNEFDSSTPIDAATARCLVMTRLTMELTAARLLAGQKECDISSLEAIHVELADLVRNSNEDIGRHQSRFENLDVSFHARLCVLAGIPFGEEAVVHAWRMVYHFT